ncbi:flagellar basal body-associated protein FliL [Sulfurimonas sp.]|uniref:flagellar basal body-associated FliL family protein n=1 Tax=Sulfurimonas sp. TaxID=2022749 RepID=UPI00356A534D
MFEKIIKIIIWIIIALIVILLLAYGVSKSSFTNLKKYDQKDTTIRNSLVTSAAKEQLAKERYYTTTVKIKDGNMANLGDFTLNISGDRQLTINISLKYKENKGNDWLSGKNVEQEILDKGDALRSAVVSTISNSENASVANTKMKKELVKSMNDYLSDGEIEEVYFNRFIIQ